MKVFFALLFASIVVTAQNPTPTPKPSPTPSSGIYTMTSEEQKDLQIVRLYMDNAALEDKIAKQSVEIGHLNTVVSADDAQRARQSALDTVERIKKAHGWDDAEFDYQSWGFKQVPRPKALPTPEATPKK